MAGVLRLADLEAVLETELARAKDEPARDSEREEEEDKKKSQPRKGGLCCICYDAVPDGDENMLYCGRQPPAATTDVQQDPVLFCGRCVYGHVASAISERRLMDSGRLPCPCRHREEGCDVDFGETEVRAIIRKSEEEAENGERRRQQHQELLQKFTRFAMDKRVETTPNLFYCPNAACDAVVDIDAEGVRGLLPTGRATCPKCTTYFCASCGQQHAVWISCSRAADAGVGEWRRSKNSIFTAGEGVKACPKCSRLVEKNGGCSHMTCRLGAGGCGHEFCWRCMGDWDGDCQRDALCPLFAFHNSAYWGDSTPTRLMTKMVGYPVAAGSAVAVGAGAIGLGLVAGTGLLLGAVSEKAYEGVSDFVKECARRRRAERVARTAAPAMHGARHREVEPSPAKHFSDDYPTLDTMAAMTTGARTTFLSPTIAPVNATNAPDQPVLEVYVLTAQANSTAATTTATATAFETLVAQPFGDVLYQTTEKGVYRLDTAMYWQRGVRMCLRHQVFVDVCAVLVLDVSAFSSEQLRARIAQASTNQRRATRLVVWSILADNGAGAAVQQPPQDLPSPLSSSELQTRLSDPTHTAGDAATATDAAAEAATSPSVSGSAGVRPQSAKSCDLMYDPAATVADEFAHNLVSTTHQCSAAANEMVLDQELERMQPQPGSFTMPHLQHGFAPLHNMKEVLTRDNVHALCSSTLLRFAMDRRHAARQASAAAPAPEAPSIDAADAAATGSTEGALNEEQMRLAALTQQTALAVRRERLVALALVEKQLAASSL